MVSRSAEKDYGQEKKKFLRMCFYNYLGLETLKNKSGMPIPPTLLELPRRYIFSSSNVGSLIVQYVWKWWKQTANNAKQAFYEINRD